MSYVFIPNVITNVDDGNHVMSLTNYNFLIKREIKITGVIDEDVSSSVVDQIHYLDERGDEDIIIIINSPGGEVCSGMAIYDAMKSCKCDVITVATGKAASMGAFLLAAGTKGKRYATETADIMIHQPLGEVKGQVTDIVNAAKHIQRTKKKFTQIMAESCGKPEEELSRDVDRDYWLSSKEAKAYGLIDYIGYPNVI